MQNLLDEIAINIDYCVNNKDIINYQIVDDKIIIHYLSGESKAIPKNIENERIILQKIKHQSLGLKDKVASKKNTIKKTKIAIGSLLISAGVFLSFSISFISRAPQMAVLAGILSSTYLFFGGVFYHYTKLLEKDIVMSDKYLRVLKKSIQDADLQKDLCLSKEKNNRVEYSLVETKDQNESLKKEPLRLTRVKKH